MKKIRAVSREPAGDVGFCRICYTQGAGQARFHISMEGDRGEDVVRAIVRMIGLYAERAGISSMEALGEVGRAVDDEREAP